MLNVRADFLIVKFDINYIRHPSKSRFELHAIGATRANKDRKKKKLVGRYDF